MAKTVTDDARYLEPLMAGQGTEGISAMVAGDGSRATTSSWCPDPTPITIAFASDGR